MEGGRRREDLPESRCLERKGKKRKGMKERKKEGVKVK